MARSRSGSLTFQLKLLTSEAKMKQGILRALSQQINKKIAGFRLGVIDYTRAIITEKIKSSPEYRSLNGGLLQAELGVPNPFDVINEIIEKVVGDMQLIITPVVPAGNKLSGGKITIVTQKVDVRNFLNLHGAKYRTNEGQDIPWLEWLLTMGDEIIVRNYRVKFTRSQASRTGYAIMIPTRRKGWRVPPQYSGTEDDNFLTRAIEASMDEIAVYIEQKFKKIFE